MNYRTCEAINHNFELTDDGDIACPVAQLMVDNSMQRAYIYANLFFYDITEREVQKLYDKIEQKRQNVIADAGVAADDVDTLFANLSAQFKMQVGDNSLDPLIKILLSQTKKQLALQPTKEDYKQIDVMKDAICHTEIQKFKKSVIFTQDNKGQPYQVDFKEKYLNNLPPRAKKILKPTIKMLAYMDGLQFATFNLDLAAYRLIYTWADVHPTFNEDALKQEIKSLIAQRPVTGV